MKVNRFISITTAILVFLVALGSFALSYNALKDMALGNGITGWLSYIWPLLIDASLIVFSLAVVNAHLQGETVWKQWSLVGVYTLATIGFNVAHAPNNLQAQIVAAIAPVSLFFSFELLMSQLRDTVKRQRVIQSITQLSREVSQLNDEMTLKAQKVSKLTEQSDTLQAQINELTRQQTVSFSANDTKPNEPMSQDDDTRQAHLNDANDTRQAQIQERREQVLTLLDKEMSYPDIANELGVSLATVKRDIKSLNGSVAK
jgi:DNA-binding NarL/FixJ family response regulator